VTAGESADEVLEVVVGRAGVLDPCDEAGGKRVAADTGEVFAEQVSCSPGIARSGGADDLDVVAFPVHLMATGTVAGRTPDGVAGAPAGVGAAGVQAPSSSGELHRRFVEVINEAEDVVEGERHHRRPLVPRW
jgi:hypothetical protein